MSYGISARIKKARKDMKMSQLDLAKAVGRSPASVSMLERGASPTVQDLVEYARVLQIKPSELLGDALEKLD